MGEDEDVESSEATVDVAAMPPCEEMATPITSEEALRNAADGDATTTCTAKEKVPNPSTSTETSRGVDNGQELTQLRAKDAAAICGNQDAEVDSNSNSLGTLPDAKRQKLVYGGSQDDRARLDEEARLAQVGSKVSDTEHL